MTDLNKMLGEMMKAKRSADAELAERFHVPYPTSHIVFGNYGVGDIDAERFTIFNLDTGEGGVFDKAEFEPHIKAFFGLNF